MKSNMSRFLVPVALTLGVIVSAGTLLFLLNTHFNAFLTDVLYKQTGRGKYVDIVEESGSWRLDGVYCPDWWSWLVSDMVTATAFLIGFNLGLMFSWYYHSTTYDKLNNERKKSQSEENISKKLLELLGRKYEENDKLREENDALKRLLPLVEPEPEGNEHGSQTVSQEPVSAEPIKMPLELEGMDRSSQTTSQENSPVFAELRVKPLELEGMERSSQITSQQNSPVSAEHRVMLPELERMNRDSQTTIQGRSSIPIDPKVEKDCVMDKGDICQWENNSFQSADLSKDCLVSSTNDGNNILLSYKKENNMSMYEEIEGYVLISGREDDCSDPAMTCAPQMELDLTRCRAGDSPATGEEAVSEITTVTCDEVTAVTEESEGRAFQGRKIPQYQGLPRKHPNGKRRPETTEGERRTTSSQLQVCSRPQSVSSPRRHTLTSVDMVDQGPLLATGTKACRRRK